MLKKIKSTILLTGAGFTKSFGGYLADEMWGAIFNQPEIDMYSRLRACLLKNINFEDVYAEVLNGNDFSTEEKTAFSEAIVRAYDEMDSAIQTFTPQATAACVDLINLFAGSGEEERGFIFTLNQDLFIERFLNVDRSFCGRVWLDMPGLDSLLWFSNKAPRQDLDIDYLFTLADAQQVAHLRDGFWSAPGTHLSYFKLHGSDNWHDPKTGLIRIIGKQKSNFINQYPLLTWYHDVFAEVVESCSNLLVIGYSFRDPHVNAPIIAALEKRLKLYVISPLRPGEFRSSLQQVAGECRTADWDPNSHKIWEGLAGYYQGTALDFVNWGKKVGDRSKAFLRNLDLV